MRSFAALIHKEFNEQLRTGKLFILIIIFIFVGIMNPAIAKLTPWMMELFSEYFTESGITVTELQVNAITSWLQFFKNIPIALLAFLLMESSIFTKEYQSGTLILTLTKGVRREKILISKALVLIAFWTFCFFISFFITYI